MLAVLGGLADVERDLIRTRTAAHMGRPPSSTPAQQKEATRRRAQGATLQKLADSYDRSISTMRRATRAARRRGLPPSMRHTVDRLTPACRAISIWGASGFARRASITFPTCSGASRL
jgi:hypothetical protein